MQVYIVRVERRRRPPAMHRKQFIIITITYLKRKMRYYTQSNLTYGGTNS